MFGWFEVWAGPTCLVVVLTFLVWGAFFNRRDVVRYAGYSPEWRLCQLLTSTAQQAKTWQVVLAAPICFPVWGLWANYLRDCAMKRRGAV